MSGADLLAPRPPPRLSVQDLEDIKNLDGMVKAWRNRVDLFNLQAEPLRKEAIALGIGKLAAYGRV